MAIFARWLLRGSLGEGERVISDAQKLRDLFPGLDACEWDITSPDEVCYNCVAWAVGDSSRWWEPTTPYYWPEKAPRQYTVAAYRAAFETLGYEACESRALEAGYEKIALYGSNGEWQHAAKQLRDGTWSSKIGYLQDIMHASLEALEGDDYGRVEVIMRRSTTERPASSTAH